MKQHLVTLTLAAVTALTCSCKNNISSNLPLSGNDQRPLDTSGPGYIDQNLAGKVFGQTWSASVAAVRPVENNPSEMFLDIYAENVSDACTPQFSLKSPMATVIIPADYTTKEYVADMTDYNTEMTGNPLTLIDYGATAKNVIAQKTKLQITELTNLGFKMNLYASAVESDGTTSEINGKMTVIDCRKKVSFNVWKTLAAQYQLVSFDGKPANKEFSVIEIDNRKRFYDRGTQKNLDTVVFPLYGSVSSGSSMQYDFGPMDGLGSTEISGQVMKYTYSGPLTYKGTDVTISLDLTVEKKESQLFVSYSLEVPGFITKKNHQFVLAK